MMSSDSLLVENVVTSDKKPGAEEIGNVVGKGDYCSYKGIR